MCEEAKESDIWQNLREKYHLEKVGEISKDLADKIIKQVETWYMKKKEIDA